MEVRELSVTAALAEEADDYMVEYNSVNEQTSKLEHVLTAPSEKCLAVGDTPDGMPSLAAMYSTQHVRVNVRCGRA